MNGIPTQTASYEADCTTPTCGDTENNNASTTIGQSSASDATWTSLVPSLCSNSYRLYCFQDP